MGYEIDWKATYKALGEPKEGVKRFAPVTYEVEKQAGANTSVFNISTGDEDRESDILVPTGAILENYMKNPVVLWAHDYYGLPIGRSLTVSPTSKGIKAKVEYAPTEFAQEVRLLVETGFLKGASVGFDPKEWTRREDQVTVDQYGYSYAGYKFLRWELMEWSVVAVPCNPYALLEEAKSKGMKVGAILDIMEKNRPIKVLIPGFTPKAYPAVGDDGKCYDADGKEVPCPDKTAPVVADQTPPTQIVEPPKVADLVVKRPTLGKPFGDYENFADCVASNQDKDDPEAYCGFLQSELESASPSVAKGIRKAGAVLNAANKSRISDARDLLQTVLDEAESLQDDATGRPAPEVVDGAAIAPGGVIKVKDDSPAHGVEYKSGEGQVDEGKQVVLRVVESPAVVDKGNIKLPVNSKEFADMIRDSVRAELNRLAGRLD